MSLFSTPSRICWTKPLKPVEVYCVLRRTAGGRGGPGNYCIILYCPGSSLSLTLSLFPVEYHHLPASYAQWRGAPQADGHQQSLPQAARGGRGDQAEKEADQSINHAFINTFSFSLFVKSFNQPHINSCPSRITHTPKKSAKFRTISKSTYLGCCWFRKLIINYIKLELIDPAASLINREICGYVSH